MKNQVKHGIVIFLFGICFLIAKDAAAQHTEQAVRNLISLMGKTEADLIAGNPALKNPDTGFNFRKVYAVRLNKDDLLSAEYYFTARQSPSLYEIIIEFRDKTMRDSIIRKMYGVPNYPGKEDYWILKGPKGLTCIAWAFRNKFVIATDIKDSEWDGDKIFILPEAFTETRNF